MRKPRFFPRDSKSLLVPQLRTSTLEALVARYLQSGDVSGFQSTQPDSFDFDDAEHIDFDTELPQNMNKIDAVLHFRNIRDSLRAPLQATSDASKSVDSVPIDAAGAPTPDATPDGSQ